MLRNRELRALGVAFAAVALAGAALAGRCTGRAAAAWVLGVALALALVVTLFTRARYRRLGRLSEQIDAVLHGERAIELDNMEEGELSILSSELGKMVDRLTMTADALERQSVSLSDSLADISHQLKTPLTSLGIIVEVARRRLAEAPEGLSPEAAHEMADRLRRAERLQERVQWLVSALLKLARIDAGVVKLADVEVEAAEVVRRAAETLAVSFDLRDVALVVEEPLAGGYHGDPLWSAEALENVLKNCMEHTPAGGCVRVWVTDDALGCRIHVEDTGPGIAEEDLPHVFERFYCGHAGAAAAGAAPGGDRATVGAAAASEFAGVGIGLALARSLVVAQGGALTATNAHGAAGRVTGARFDMTFFRVTV